MPEITFLNNSLNDYIVATGVLVGLVAGLVIARKIVLAKLSATTPPKSSSDRILAVVTTMAERVSLPFFVFGGLYVALQILTIPPYLDTGLTVMLIVWLVILCSRLAHAVAHALFGQPHGDETNPRKKSVIHIINVILQITIWSFGLLMLLSNLGVDVTSLIAGLGIGGIAVALAAQNILGDVFASLVIYIDKPFEPGDFIVVGDKMGTVEKIGLKTTRLRALQGELVIISNKELTSAHIQNYKRMEERRIQFTFGVIYETSDAVLREIPGTIKKIVEGVDRARFDRAHLKSFDDSALLYEVVYYVTTADYNQYMDVQQEINFRIRDAFNQQKIQMAYPTRTVYVKQ